MAIEIDPVEMWNLNEDSSRICLELPLLSFEEISEPIQVRLRFDAETIDAMLERLTLLRRRMVPKGGRSGFQ
jgi:hypothetical protein